LPVKQRHGTHLRPLKLKAIGTSYKEVLQEVLTN
jgi:hypothetical protein